MEPATNSLWALEPKAMATWKEIKPVDRQAVFGKLEKILATVKTPAWPRFLKPRRRRRRQETRRRTLPTNIQSTRPASNDQNF